MSVQQLSRLIRGFFIVVFLTACTDADKKQATGTPVSTTVETTAIPEQTEVIYEWEADPVLITMQNEPGGLDSYEYAWNLAPQLAVYADGRVIGTEWGLIGPNWLPRYWQGVISNHELCRLLIEINSLGFLDSDIIKFDASDYTDLETTNISIQAWKPKSVSSYGLDFSINQEGEMINDIPPELAETYKLLSNFRPPNASPFEPERVALLIRRSESDKPAELWSLTQPKLSELTAELGETGRIEAVVEGQQAAEIFAQFRGEYTKLFWEQGQVYEATVRPLFPLEIWDEEPWEWTSEFKESPRVNLTCSNLVAEIPWLTSLSTPQEVFSEPGGDQAPLEYVDSIGKQNLPGQLDIIGSAVGTPNGNLLVADISNDRLQRFALDGTVLDAFPLLGSSAYGLAFLPNGNLVIANSRLNAVEIRTLEGELLQSIDGWPPPESDYISSSDEIDLLAVDLDGKIYTGEKWGNRVINLNNDGSLLGIWNGPGDNQFELISDIATDSLGNLFVVDQMQGKVVKRSPTGEIREFTIGGSYIAPRPDGSFYISQGSSINLYDSDGNQLKQFEIGGYIEDVILAPDDSGVVIKSDIEDMPDGALHLYDEDRTLLASFGTTLPLPGQFSSHVAFSVSSAGDVWVIDSGNSLNFGTGPKRLVHLDETYSHLNTFDNIEGEVLTCHDYSLAALVNQGVFVADPCMGTITLVDAEGQVLEQWGKRGLESGQINLISDIALAPDERSLYLTDSGDNRVIQYELGGEVIAEWDSEQLDVQMPIAIDVSTNGTFFLIDGATFEIVILPQQGPPLKWMLPITHESPHDIALDENRQRIYVGDTDVNLYTYDWNGKYLGYQYFHDSSGVMVSVGVDGLVYRSAGFQEIQVFKPTEIANE